MRTPLVLGSIAVAAAIAYTGWNGSGTKAGPELGPGSGPGSGANAGQVQGQAPSSKGRSYQSEPTKSEVAPFEAEGHAIEPYVVHRGSTELRIAWRLHGSAPSEVHLLTAGEAPTVQEFPASIQHVATFSDLRPDTLYSYRVEGYPARDVYTLSDDNRRSFAIVGHTHGTEHMEHYPDTLLAARIEEFRPDFMLHAGDCVYFSTPKGWKQDFFSPFRDLLKSTPIYISPSNHDVGWPFVLGMDMRCVRELFPHAYPEQADNPTEDAFYHVRQGSIDFYFLAYVADMTMEGTQLPWLKEELAKSDAAFRVLVFGGANPYYDKEALAEELKDQPIDLIINGDGAATKKIVDTSGPIPRLVMGTAGAQPHPWLACTSTDYWATFKVMYADGASSVSFQMHDKRVRTPIFDLGEPKVKVTGKKRTLSFTPPKPIPSDQVRGLQIKLKKPAGARGLAWIFAGPVKRERKSELGFRSEHHSIGATDSLVTFSIPQTNPLATEPYLIKKIQLELLELHKGCELELESAYLFGE